jgi:DNA-binding transcriptional ArsR family regulator
MGKKRELLVFTIISHPVRVKIIELLANHGPMGFKELKKELGISTGSIYHHLSMLSDFIIQNEDKKYMLNEEGIKLYKFIKKSEYKLTNQKQDNNFVKIYNILNGNILFSFLINNIKFTILTLPFIIILYFTLFYYSNLSLRFVFIKDVSEISLFDVILNFTINWIFIYLILDFIISIFLKNKKNHIYLFLLIPFAFLPLGAYSLIFKFITQFQFQAFIRFLFVIFQAWSIVMLIKAIQIIKSENLQNSIITIFVLYFISLAYFLSF